MQRTLIVTALIALIAFVLIYAQIYLSKRNSPFPGLILPAVSVLQSIVQVLNLTAPEGGYTTGWAIFQVAMVFLYANVFTFLLLAIYFGLRRGRR